MKIKFNELSTYLGVAWIITWAACILRPDLATTYLQSMAALNGAAKILLPDNLHELQ